MFDRLFKRHFVGQCPACKGGLYLRIKVGDLDSPEFSEYRGGVQVTDAPCFHCRTRLSIVVYKKKTLRAYDVGWDASERRHRRAVEAMEDELEQIEARLRETPDDEELQRKAARLSDKIDDAEDAFTEKECARDEKYDRLERKRISGRS